MTCDQGCGIQGDGSLAPAVTGQNYHLGSTARCYGIFIPDSGTQQLLGLLRVDFTSVTAPALRNRCIESYFGAAA